VLSFESYSIAIAYYLKEDLLPLENFYRTAIIGNRATKLLFVLSLMRRPRRNIVP
jgi:hypothetical protein